jgi:hypothetical protein
MEEQALVLERVVVFLHPAALAVAVAVDVMVQVAVAATQVVHLVAAEVAAI